MEDNGQDISGVGWIYMAWKIFTGKSTNPKAAKIQGDDVGTKQKVGVKFGKMLQPNNQGLGL